MVILSIRISIILGMLVVSISCTHKSIFTVEQDQNKDYVFQACGGQQWGYVKELESEKGKLFQAVYIQTQMNQSQKTLHLNFAIQSHGDLDVEFKNRRFKVLRDGITAHDQPADLFVIRGEKSISQRYPGTEYRIRSIEGSNDHYEVSKKKFGGSFGDLLLEDPVIVKVEKYPVERISSDKLSVNFDVESYDAVYILSTAVIANDVSSIKTSLIKALVPGFTINGVAVPESEYTFHFDREKLVERVKSARKCLNLEMVFRSGRLRIQDNWLVPKIK